MLKNYGHYLENKLSEVIENKDFKQYWNLSKDRVSVCRNCEFRYICSNCRAYTENPKDIYSKLLVLR